MKNFYKIGLFLIFVFLFDLVIGAFLNNKLADVNYGFIGKINNSLKDQSDILILGSSRAMHHYDPDIFERVFFEKTFNAGVGGYGIFLNYAILAERIKKVSKPKIVILDISPNVVADKKSYDKLNSLLPYYKHYASFKEIICLNQNFSKLSLIFNSVIFNSTIFDFVKDHFVVKRHQNGYVPLNFVMDSLKYTRMIYQSDVIDSNKIRYYEKIIYLCKNNNIELYTVVSPCYQKFDRKNEIINLIKNISDKLNVPFFDFSNDTTFKEKAYLFKDQLHLNSKGAELFSKIVSEKIYTLSKTIK